MEEFSAERQVMFALIFYVFLSMYNVVKLYVREVWAYQKGSVGVFLRDFIC